MARLWQEYAKADARWGTADLNIVSLEILTVFLAGPGAMYICYLVAKVAKLAEKGGSAAAAKTRAQLLSRMWFIAAMVATGELYGGFMTFAPEWLSGSTQLATEDPVYLWLYLVFFNVLWVFVPLWVLREAWCEMTSWAEKAVAMEKKGN